MGRNTAASGNCQLYVTRLGVSGPRGYRGWWREPTRGGRRWRASGSPPGWTRERDSGLLQVTIGWGLPPLVGKCNTPLPASADSESELVLRRLASEGQIVIMILRLTGSLSPPGAARLLAPEIDRGKLKTQTHGKQCTLNLYDQGETQSDPPLRAGVLGRPPNPRHGPKSLRDLLALFNINLKDLEFAGHSAIEGITRYNWSIS